MTALLFADFESTSLDTDFATLLEGAWCVTDLDGTLRSPLRSRYLAIAPDGVTAIVPDGGGWTPAGGQYAALRMAEDSRLHSDWSASPSTARVTRAGDLERLVLDDLLSVCDQGDDIPDPERGRGPETVHICGAGAARYDFSLLRLHCPQLVPPPGNRHPVHYRPVDTSGNQTGLLGDNHEAEMIAWYLRELGHIDAELSPDLGITLGDWPSFCYPNRDVASWLTGEKHRHRAAPDVVRAVIVQRMLWRYGKELRAELGVTDA